MRGQILLKKALRGFLQNEVGARLPEAQFSQELPIPIGELQCQGGFVPRNALVGDGFPNGSSKDAVFTFGQTAALWVAASAHGLEKGERFHGIPRIRGRGPLRLLPIMG